MTEAKNTELIKTQDLVGKQVVSLQGEEVGTITRVVVDPSQSQVIGLTVNVKGWFKGDKGLEFEAVKSFGDYAVTIERAGQVVPLAGLPTMEKLAQDYNIYGMKIITPDGKLIGSVDDFYFSKSTGTIERYILTGGVIKNLFHGRGSIPAVSIDKIGQDFIIAGSDVESAIQKEDSGLTDNLETLKSDLGQWKGDLGQWKGDLGQWKDDFDKIWDKTRNRVQDISKTVSDNLKEAAKTGKDKGQQIFTITGELLNEKKNDLKESYDLWMTRLQAGSERPLTEEDIKALVGLRAGKAVTDSSGTVIIGENEPVSSETIEAARKSGRIRELLISVATRDLEDKMDSMVKPE